MPMANMSAIMKDGIPGKKPSHYCCNRYSTGSEKQMEMIGHKRPRIAGGIGFCQNMAEAFQKIFMVSRIQKNFVF
jgi:hypothetical protein